MAVNLLAREKKGTEQHAICEFLKIIRPQIESMGLKISDQKNLPYTNFCSKVDKNGYGINYKKGQKPYTVDVLIYRELENEEIIPLVVIEGKIKSYTTHDVLAYSEKAKTHKNIFPHLQYGFLVLEADHDKFRKYYYMHEQFDFAEIFPKNEAIKENETRINNFVAELKKQIELAESKYALFFNN